MVTGVPADPQSQHACFHVLLARSMYELSFINVAVEQSTGHIQEGHRLRFIVAPLLQGHYGVASCYLEYIYPQERDQKALLVALKGAVTPYLALSGAEKGSHDRLNMGTSSRPLRKEKFWSHRLMNLLPLAEAETWLGCRSHKP